MLSSIHSIHGKPWYVAQSLSLGLTYAGNHQLQSARPLPKSPHPGNAQEQASHCCPIRLATVNPTLTLNLGLLTPGIVAQTQPPPLHPCRTETQQAAASEDPTTAVRPPR